MQQTIDGDYPTSAGLPHWTRKTGWERGRLKRCWMNEETRGLVQVHCVHRYENTYWYEVSFGAFQMEPLAEELETVDAAHRFAVTWMENHACPVPPELEPTDAEQQGDA